jgi:MarR family transcriptional regulator, 2-MHQ and catechol-resistance regulon repressor
MRTTEISLFSSTHSQSPTLNFLILICVRTIIIIKTNLKYGNYVTPEPENLPSLAASEPFMPVISELVCAYQAFRSYSDAHIRHLGLTSSQFDVLAALGNSNSMSFSQLAEKILTTKGELTGIIDRLETKGLVRREVPKGDRRSFLAVLTEEGKRVFAEIFPAHIDYLKQRFGKLESQELEDIQKTLGKIKNLF